jgi:hypothetical protein
MEPNPERITWWPSSVGWRWLVIAMFAAPIAMGRHGWPIDVIRIATRDLCACREAPVSAGSPRRRIDSAGGEPRHQAVGGVRHHRPLPTDRRRTYGGVAGISSSLDLTGLVSFFRPSCAQVIPLCAGGAFLGRLTTTCAREAEEMLAAGTAIVGA